MSTQERFHTVVVGGGQAGLAASYYLAQARDDYIVLDAGSRAGDSWRSRWDSLRLFTPAKFSSLPGMRFPGDDFSFPSKEEAATYLEGYSREFEHVIRHNTKVDSLVCAEGGFAVQAGADRFHASRVIVATGAYQRPFIPSFSSELDERIVQLHSSAYRNPLGLPSGPVLVVGAGNSGAELAIELARAGRRVWLSGRDVGRIPADTLGRVLGGKPYWLLISRVLSIDTPVGRKVRAAQSTRGTPLIGARPKDITAAGVTRVGRMSEVRDGRPVIEDGQALDVSVVIWATGFRPDYSWIRPPVCDESGIPRHERGAALDVAGLYFLGLPFQTSLSSSLLGGVGGDACSVTRAALAS